jgi:hypothetical protein
MLVGAFGLIHGAGFANYLRALFLDSIAVPLVGFNVGVEIGQLLVVGIIWVGMTALDRLPMPRVDAYRARVATVSVIVTLVSSVWVVERL